MEIGSKLRKYTERALRKLEQIGILEERDAKNKEGCDNDPESKEEI